MGKKKPKMHAKKGYPFAVMDTTTEPAYQQANVDILWMRRKWNDASMIENHLAIMIVPIDYHPIDDIHIQPEFRTRILNTHAKIVQCVDTNKCMLLEYTTQQAKEELLRGYMLSQQHAKAYDLGSLVEDAKLYLQTIRNEYTSEDTTTPKTDPFGLNIQDLHSE